jgi:hypothetical protein
MTLDFLQDKSKVACASRVLLASSGSRYLEYGQHFPENFSGMHLFSFVGLDTISMYQLECGDKAISRDSNGRTPLLIALKMGMTRR